MSISYVIVLIKKRIDGSSLKRLSILDLTHNEMDDDT